MLDFLKQLLAAAIICISPIAADAGAPPTTHPEPSLVEQLEKFTGDDSALFAEHGDAQRAGKGLTQKLSALSDTDLEAVFVKLGRGRWQSVGRDLCLTEMIHRGGAVWEKVIQAALDKEAADDLKTLQPAAKKANVVYDIVLLTALRRVQKKDDPLPILVEGTSEIRFHIGYPPAIMANLTNLDPEKVTMGLSTGGDYRGASRHNKYRLEITDAAGRHLPEREEFDMGGFVNGQTLRSRESFPMELEIGAYVHIDKPGIYTMIVLYHPSLDLANLAEVSRMVCCQSIPITLIVDPIQIETTDAEQATLAALILKLPEKGTVRILGGVYHAEGAGDFLPKESPAAQIQIAAWNAVPPLIAAVNGAKLNPTQRAWALGLLYAITGRNNPTRSPGVLGPFQYRFSGWVSTANSDGRGSFSQSEESVPQGTIDPAAQTAFAKTWMPWMENGAIEMRKTKEK